MAGVVSTLPIGAHVPCGRGGALARGSTHLVTNCVLVPATTVAGPSYPRLNGRPSFACSASHERAALLPLRRFSAAPLARRAAAAPPGAVAAGTDAEVAMGELNVDAEKLGSLMKEYGVTAGPISLGVGQRGRGIFLPEGTPSDQAPGTEGTDVAALMGEELLLAVPRGLCLYVGLEAGDGGPIYPEEAGLASPALAGILEGAKVDAKLRLASLLLWATGPAAAEGEDGKVGQAQALWRRYLEYLPLAQEQTTLVAFAPEEAAEMQDAVMEDEAAQNAAGIENWHAALASYWEGTEMEDALGDGPERLQWALATVSERSLTLVIRGGEEEEGAPALCLVPFVDMLNHASQGAPDCGATVRAINEGDPFTANLTLPHGVFVTHKRGAAASSEACFSYLSGVEASSGRLMRSFGFVLGENEFDVVELNASSPVEGSLLSRIFQTAPPPPGAPAGGAVGAGGRGVAILPLAPRSEGPATPTKHTNPGAAMAEARAVEGLIAQCERDAAGFSTTEEEDRALLEALPSSPPSRTRAAVEYRLQRKRLYGAVLAELTRYRDAIEMPERKKK